MPFQISAGVNVSEIDLTTVVPAVATTEGAIAGHFRWGPANQPILISSESELVRRFGKPTTENFETFFTAASFLAYGNKLFVSRAVDANSAFNCNAVANNGTAVANTLIENLDDFLVTPIPSGATYFAKYPGAMGNSLRVSVCDSAEAYASVAGTVTVDPTDNDLTFEFTPGSETILMRVVNSNTSPNTASANTEAYAALATLSVGDQLVFGNSTIGTQTSIIRSIGTPLTVDAGESVTQITLDERVRALSPFVQTTVQRQWEFAGLVDRAPGTTLYAEARGGVGDELHVVVIDEGGEFTGTQGTVLELYEAVSRATDAKGEQGGTLYYADVINQGSQYIWHANHLDGAPANTAANIVASTNDKAYSARMSGGISGRTEDTMPVASVVSAYDKFRNAEAIDVSLILAGKARGEQGVGIANYLIDNIAEYRKDCVVFISPEREDVVSAPGFEAQNVVDFRNRLRSTSYAVLDSGYKYMYDRYNDVYRYVPLNGDIAGLAVRTDETRDPWWSPAGFNRGQIKNVVKLAHNPDKANRDLLYKNGVNPVVSFPGQGIVLYGDKTLLAKPSAFDRINVRRLFIVLEKAIATAAKFTLFEFNDEFTRAQFRNLVEPYLRDVQGRRGIYDFRVVCDESNNTGEVIDRNEFIGDIYIKPARSINFIQLNFVAVRTGVEFSEVVGKF